MDTIEELTRFKDIALNTLGQAKQENLDLTAKLAAASQLNYSMGQELRSASRQDISHGGSTLLASSVGRGQDRQELDVLYSRIAELESRVQRRDESIRQLTRQKLQFVESALEKDREILNLSVGIMEQVRIA